MKLAYSIPGKLWWIQDFLDVKFYKELHHAIIKQRQKLKLHSSKGIYPEYLLKNVEAPLRRQISEYEPFERLLTLIKLNPYSQIHNIVKTHSIVHYMKKSSGINWHDDGLWKYGATYYINRRWNHNFGGEFMFADNVAHGFIPPVGNSLVIVKSPFKHKVNPVLTPIMPRISVQVFMK
jgi:Rps23 Pro-64 3,4-dihydroxylase Tpa1-like proline 4-hydroxylase|tara:strand:- start:154 stop:687 length:534 start_codon:yes stop_codon:yes gene_type:complete